MRIRKIELPSEGDPKEEYLKKLRKLARYIRGCQKGHDLPDLDGEDMDMICEALALQMSMIALDLGQRRKLKERMKQ